MMVWDHILSFAKLKSRKKINKKRRQLDNLGEEVRKRKLNSLSSSLFSEVINDRQWKVEKEETKGNYILPKHCKEYIGYKLSNLLGKPGMGRGGNVVWTFFVKLRRATNVLYLASPYLLLHFVKERKENIFLCHWLFPDE